MPSEKPKPKPLAQWVLVTLLIVPLAAAGIYFATRPLVEVPDADGETPVIARNRNVEVGGVRRPASDLGIEADLTNDKLVKSDKAARNQAVGVVPAQKWNANPAVASTHAALVNATHPERLSPMFAPKPFDRVSYEVDPKPYLSVHEPGRVWQSAQPGADVPVIASVSPRLQRITQGEAVRLSVKTEPNMPATFTSFDLGTFSNGLASITVAADAEGVAAASFNGSSGTLGQINILAASPVAAERIKFNVLVVPRADIKPGRNAR